MECYPNARKLTSQEASRTASLSDNLIKCLSESLSLMSYLETLRITRCAERSRAHYEAMYLERLILPILVPHSPGSNPSPEPLSLSQGVT